MYTYINTDIASWYMYGYVSTEAPPPHIGGRVLTVALIPRGYCV